MSQPPRVMLDANLLIAAFLAPASSVPGHPASRQVMQWAREGRVVLVLCPYVIAEARRMIGRAFRQRLAAFDEMIASTPHELAPDPDPETVSAHLDLVADPADVPVALAALAATVDVLLSSDHHLIAEDESTRELRSRLKTMAPSRFVDEFMERGWE